MSEQDQVDRWLAGGRPLDDTTACIIASWWHGGLKSGLYSFVSTGNVTPEALNEVESELRAIRERQAQLDQIPALEALGRYLRARGGDPDQHCKIQTGWPVGRPKW